MAIFIRIIAGIGLVLLILFYYLFSQSKGRKKHTQMKLYSVLAYIGLVFSTISISIIASPYVLASIPRYGVLLLVAIDIAILVLGVLIMLFPAFRTPKRSATKGARKVITPNGTQVVNQPKTKKKKHKGNSMTGSDKRRMPRL